MLLEPTEIRKALRRREVLLFSSYYFIMGRKAKRCPKKCVKHSFLLKPVHYSANFSRELQASFCPASLTELSITPSFNKDKRYFTSSFYLPVESEKLENNQEYYRTEHEKYKIENADQKSNILVPKPRTKNNYCNACKTEYDDYLDHIKSGNHKSKIRENRFNQYIEEMCSQVQNKMKEEEEKPEDIKFLQNSDTFLSFSSQDQNPFQERSPEKSYVPYFSVFEYRQINELLLSSRNFQPLQEQKSLGLFQMQNEIGFILPPISPIKKYSEATECLRTGSSSKLDRPIIIFGGNMGKSQ